MPGVVVTQAMPPCTPPSRQISLPAVAIATSPASRSADKPLDYMVKGLDCKCQSIQVNTAARDVAILLLRAATQINEDINSGVVNRGFADVRPAHGFAFVRISAGDATVVDLAQHLGVTKQAASQLVLQ
jgi:hypothetical protein